MKKILILLLIISLLFSCSTTNNFESKAKYKIIYNNTAYYTNFLVVGEFPDCINFYSLKHHRKILLCGNYEIWTLK